MPNHRMKPHHRHKGPSKQHKLQTQIEELQQKLKRLEQENKDLNEQIDCGRHFALSWPAPGTGETSQKMLVESAEPKAFGAVNCVVDEEKNQSPTNSDTVYKHSSTTISAFDDQSIRSTAAKQQYRARVNFQRTVELLERCKALDERMNKIAEREAEWKTKEQNFILCFEAANRTLDAKKQKLDQQQAAFESTKLKIAVGASAGFCAALGCVGYSLSR